MHRRAVLTAVGTAITGPFGGCLSQGERQAAVLDAGLTVAVTTSIYDTGLFDDLQAAFTDRYGVDVQTVSQGTGAALQTARRGDCDTVMMHARSLEDDFLREGAGINRRAVMASDFVVVGPADDPAGIDGMVDVPAAFAAIAEAEATFISRGDGSGTHRRETEIWAAIDVEPSGDWYREIGTGMGNALVHTDEAGAYTLAVRGTFLAMQSDLDIGIRLAGPATDQSEFLSNPYGIAAINPARHEEVAYDLAMAFIGYITSPDGQELIRTYTIDGAQLFVPIALSPEPQFSQYVPTEWRQDG